VHPAPRIAVLGLGNVLMGDDAVGPWVVRLLEASYEFPDDVRVADLGTPGLDLSPHLDGLEAVILVDAVNEDGPPGAVHKYGRADLLQVAPFTRISPHEPGVKEALLLAEIAGRAPRDVRVVGVTPGRVAQGVGLTPEVRDAVPRAASRVLAELSYLQVLPRPRWPPRTPDIWWESPSAPRLPTPPSA
jgi:hydrogenase maturation protease